ncbi:AraC family transcriptional regulator [Granulicella arctica]|uniref:AraC family transcriptional regulator n=1 Tax=Granulicella arctica TaxID=940613 RepID=UPI0037C133FB
MHQLGMRPKLFARIARFEAALEFKAHFDLRLWTSVAHTFGYYDQMHMIRDFAEFTGGTPSETLNQPEKSLWSRSGLYERPAPPSRKRVLYGSSCSALDFEQLERQKVLLPWSIFLC